MVSMEGLPSKKSVEKFHIPEKLLTAAHAKAERILSLPEFHRIQETDFHDYDQKKVSEDLETVAALEKRWRESGEEETIEGIIAEGFLLDMLSRARWFGDIAIRRTSKTDDYLNHIDALADLRSAEVESYVGLGIDTTTRAASLHKKLSGIHQRAQQGMLGTVRYADIDSFHGRMTQVPETVLLLDRASFKDTMQRWVAGVEGGKGAPQNDLSEFHTLAIHPLQIELLGQMWSQFDFFSRRVAGNNAKKMLHLRSVASQKINERRVAMRLDQATTMKILRESKSIATMKAALAKLG